MNGRDPAFPNRPEWLTRPARKQVDDATLQKEIQARGGPGERNLWSGRRIGPSVGGPGGGDGKRGSQRGKDASKYRCILELDVGRTRGSDAKQHVFCLYFAKGCCSQGSACTYLHRLPTAEDEAYAVRDLSADIFGREKRAESEGYRSGAGTLDRDNRTLYINYEGAGAYDLPKVRQLLDANFRVFGPVNNIYIVHHKTIAFVRYDWRSSAEFAKEAMHKQALVGSTLGEVVTARWANEDPNPVAVLAQKRAAEEAFGHVVMSSFDSLPAAQKQARIMELQLQSALQKGAAIGSYPSTDLQFEEQERLQRELEQRRQQEERQAAAGSGNEEEEEEDIPYIPDDIYEEQQRRLTHQPQAQQQQSGVAEGGGIPASFGRAAQAVSRGEGAAEAVTTEGEPADFHDAAAGAAAAAAAGAEAPEWEKAWSDPALREQLRANPELRERMRRARNEAVYWSAYQAHYSAYANSYGNHTAQEEHQQQQQQYGELQYEQHAQQGAGYSWQDYYAWYGQQGPTEAHDGSAVAAVAQTSTGFGAVSAAVGVSGAGATAVEAGLPEAPSVAQGQGDTGGTEGAGRPGAENMTNDVISLLGTTYGSDEEGED